MIKDGSVLVFYSALFHGAVAEAGSRNTVLHSRATGCKSYPFDFVTVFFSLILKQADKNNSVKNNVKVNILN
jgi:ectoine hydroxylase-related dioxygenase (phytanoyl-CoA dioxygenase family)